MRSSSDRAFLILTGLFVAGLAVVAGAISFAHMVELAQRHDQAGWKAYAFPVMLRSVTRSVQARATAPAVVKIVDGVSRARPIGFGWRVRSHLDAPVGTTETETPASPTTTISCSVSHELFVAEPGG